MRPAPDTLTQIDELPGEEISFGIGDPRWVMRTQAKLYSDVTTAIIREYSTNAYDAHVMAGHRDPIEVTMPSIMDPFFVVKDHGVGMNMDLFRQVYTQFGVSDKRESNDTNGQLGYGSKSGVAYTNQFSVTSVRDGIKINGVIMRKPDWEIVLKVVSKVRTDDPNGTTITIPVHNIEEFNHKAREFYKFWMPGRVLVNGKEPAHNVGKKITDNLYYSNEWNTSYVVLGNVAYKINNPDALFRDTKMNRLNFVAYVDDYKTIDGAAPVEFVPSREDLEYSDRTKTTLHAIVKDFETKILVAAKADVASATTHAEAYNAWREWTDALGRGLFADLEFKGDKFVSEFKIPAWRYATQRYSYATQRINQWSVEQMHNTMVVTGFTPKNLASDHKKKAKEYARIQGWNLSYILFTEGDDDVDSVWVDKTRFVDWETLKSALPKKAPKPRQIGITGGRLPGSFDIITKDGRQNEQVISSTNNLFFITIQDEKDWNVRQVLTLLGSSATVVILGANRLKKFNRDYPSVKEFTKWAQAKVVIDGPSLLSDDAKKIRGIDHSVRAWANALDVSRVDDPEFAAVRELIKNEKSLTKAYEDNLTLARWVKMWYSVKEHRATEDASLMRRYPLLAYLNYNRHPEHVYIYLNAAYAAETNR